MLCSIYQLRDLQIHFGERNMLPSGNLAASLCPEKSDRHPYRESSSRGDTVQFERQAILLWRERMPTTWLYQILSIILISKRFSRSQQVMA
eukprot:jgi/Botrbrau1/1442/Bobra.0063s0133.1